MTKAARQARLLEIVRRRRSRTQEELAAALAEIGVEVSQVTLSRDLRELGVMKAPEGYREAGSAGVAAPPDQLARVLRDFVVSIRPAGNLVVIQTNPGGAGAVALALDRSGRDEIVGTVAGDDTIFVATDSAAEARRLAAELGRLLGL